MTNKRSRSTGKLKMADLARLAGVSKSTVSRALAGNELINPETREKIQELARQHNYRLNARARNFRLKESLTIAVLIPSADEAKWQITDPFFLELLGGIATALGERGHDMLLSSINLHAEDFFEQGIHKIQSDGIVIIGQSNIHGRLKELAEVFPAMVVWGGQLPDQNYCTVGSDNFAGGRLATEHLVKGGCSRIVFLGDRTVPEGTLRYQGYRAALEAAGLQADPALEVHSEASKAAGFDAIAELLAGKVSFDAVFAISDTLAMAAMSALAERGLAVPRDVCVVGYDDISIAAYYTPTLSSVHQDRQEGGRLLVEKLLALIEGEPAESEVLPTSLVVRRSSLRPGD